MAVLIIAIVVSGGLFFFLHKGVVSFSFVLMFLFLFCFSYGCAITGSVFTLSGIYFPPFYSFK